jgi:hypothetical protein
MQINLEPRSVLLFGGDARLVETRSWVLTLAGYRTSSTLELHRVDEIASKNSIDLFLLCDSLIPRMRHRAIELIGSKWPSAKRLVLTPASPFFDIGPSEHTCPAIEGPRKLVATIHNLMTDGAAPSPEANVTARSSLRRSDMHCNLGFELYQQYELAEKAKIASNGRRIPNNGAVGVNLSEKEFLAAKQRYLESFANWLSHKAFCHDCKPKA